MRLQVYRWVLELFCVVLAVKRCVVSAEQALLNTFFEIEEEGQFLEVDC